MAARSLRAHLLRILLPPIAALLGIGFFVAYYPTIEPATEAYDQALVDIALALGAHVKVTPSAYEFDIPPAVEQVLRTDRYDTISYRVLSPGGLHITGDPGIPPPDNDNVISYDGVLNGKPVRIVSVFTPCGRSASSQKIPVSTPALPPC